MNLNNYIIPSDNWEQQLDWAEIIGTLIISYQAITGNNNAINHLRGWFFIISYQAITGNNNHKQTIRAPVRIISYQAITGNNNGNYSIYGSR